jgi:hypothetical protein
MVFGEDIIFYQLNGSTVLTMTPSAVTIASGVPLKVGTSGKEVYSPDNPPPVTGGWSTVRDFTVTGGASDTISVADPTNGLFEDGYDYRVICRGLKASSGTGRNVDVQVGTGTSTISWVTGSYDNATYGALGADPGGQVSTNTQARITQTSGQGVGNGDNAGLYGEFIVYNPRHSGSRTRIKGDFWQRDSPRALTWHAVRRTEAADTSLRIVLSASTFNAVQIILQKRVTGDDS